MSDHDEAIPVETMRQANRKRFDEAVIKAKAEKRTITVLNEPPAISFFLDEATRGIPFVIRSKRESKKNAGLNFDWLERLLKADRVRIGKAKKLDKTEPEQEADVVARIIADDGELVDREDKNLLETVQAIRAFNANDSKAVRLNVVDALRLADLGLRDVVTFPAIFESLNLYNVSSNLKDESRGMMMSASGCFTHLHVDTQCQLLHYCAEGSKTWILLDAQDEQLARFEKAGKGDNTLIAYPESIGTKAFVYEMNAGDLFYMPPGIGHAVLTNQPTLMFQSQIQTIVYYKEQARLVRMEYDRFAKGIPLNNIWKSVWMLNFNEIENQSRQWIPDLTEQQRFELGKQMIAYYLFVIHTCDAAGHNAADEEALYGEGSRRERSRAAIQGALKLIVLLDWNSEKNLDKFEVQSVHESKRYNQLRVQIEGEPHSMSVEWIVRICSIQKPLRTKHENSSTKHFHCVWCREHAPNKASHLTKDGLIEHLLKVGGPLNLFCM